MVRTQFKLWLYGLQLQTIEVTNLPNWNQFVNSAKYKYGEFKQDQLTSFLNLMKQNDQLNNKLNSQNYNPNLN